MKIGDRVICIDDSDQGATNQLIKGREYIIYNILRCDKCNKPKIDVGIFIEFNIFSTMKMVCYSCGDKIEMNKGDVRLFNPNRFRKVEEQVNYVKLEVEIEEPCLN